MLVRTGVAYIGVKIVEKHGNRYRLRFGASEGDYRCGLVPRS